MKKFNFSKIKNNKILRKMILALGILAIAGILTSAILNVWVVFSAKGSMYQSPEGTETYEISGNPDCILILGAGLYGEEPSPMLKDRLDKGIEWYQQGKAPKILMSGDHGRTGYNEVEVMKQYAINAGVPSQDIFMDHAGFSTYESMIRARDIFGVKNPIVITQRYHMYRALFIGNHLGLDCIGVQTNGYPYGGKPQRLIREYIARCKDVFTVLTGAKPTFGGEPIPITGDGDVTND